jgi:hypothetical protein
MASYSVNRAKSATLGVATVDTVTFPATYPYETVTVINKDATSPIYFTLDGTTPTVAGDECFCVPVNQNCVASFQGGAVKLIAAAAAAYTVQAE